MFFYSNYVTWRAISVIMGFHNDSHRLGRLNTSNLFSYSFGGQRLEIRLRKWCDSAENAFLAHLTTFSCSGGRGLRSLPCLLRVLGPWDQWSDLTVFFHLTTCSKPLNPNPVLWREGEVTGADDTLHREMMLPHWNDQMDNSSLSFIQISLHLLKMHSNLFFSLNSWKSS